MSSELRRGGDVFRDAHSVGSSKLYNKLTRYSDDGSSAAAAASNHITDHLLLQGY